MDTQKDSEKVDREILDLKQKIKELECGHEKTLHDFSKGKFSLTCRKHEHTDVPKT